MKTQLPERSLVIQDRISLIVDEILSIAKHKIAKIILFGSYARGTWVNDKYIEGHITYTYESDLDILIIFKKGKYSKLQESKLEDKINQRLESKNLHNKPWVTLVIEPIGRVNELLTKGQYFFSDIKKDGILLYDNGELLASAKVLSNSERREMAQDDYDYWFYRGSEFLIDCNNARGRDNFSMAAFYLHQATESLYNAILLVFTGYKPKIHDIFILKGVAGNYSEDLLKIFPSDTKEQRDCFKLLRVAYIEGRYNKCYNISKEQLLYLIERVKKLKEITARICLSKIESYSKLS